MQEFIGMIVVGALIGAIARLVKPGKQPIGVLVTIILGALGAGIGGWLVELFGYANANGGVQWIKWIVAVAVASVLISVYMTVAGSKKRSEK